VTDRLLPLFDDDPDAPSASALAASMALPASAGHLDELRDAAAPGGISPHWAQFFEHLGHEGFGDLNRRQQSLARQLRDNGVTYNVYADNQGIRRPWALDLFPMLVSPQSWQRIEAGVLQRTRLLNLILSDMYGEQRLLREALLPAALVQGHPGYLRAMRGVTPPGNTWLHIAAFDLAHGPDGRWWIVSHRTQAPSGLGYLLENRIAISRQFPTAFGDMKVQRLASSYRALMQGLRRLSPKGSDARIALLTPGPYSETYFEHAYLARYLGLNLVEGNDLTVRDRRVFLKTLQGLQPVDIIIKRLDDQWLDPLEFRSDSALGVPGLMQAVRAGHVLLANTPGSAPLESSALLGFLPGIAEELLGEKLALPSLATWWCGEAASLNNALPILKQSVIKSTYPHLGGETVIGPSLSASGIEQLTGRMVRQPEEHTVQSYLPLSQCPTWQGENIAPRGAMLRVFALADGAGSWRVLPGGMVRLAPRGQLIASMQRGGSSADCWVITDGEVDRTSLLQSAPSTLSVALQPRLITSRAAENLFWLGRYTERAENTIRLAQIALRCLQGEEQGAPALLHWITATARSNALVLPDVPDAAQARRVFERSLVAMLGAESGTTSVGYNLAALRRSADNVRERLSQEQRHLIERLDEGFRTAHRSLSTDAEYAPQEALEALEDASELLSAVTGAQIDRMVRDDGWRMLSIGRHIERVSTLAEALALGLQTGMLEDDSGFEALLDLFDSSITFHAQYQQRRDLVALLDLLVTHRDNPRSIAWVLSTLRARVSKLPMADSGAAIMLAENLPDPNSWDLIALSGLRSAEVEAGTGTGTEAAPHAELHALLTECQRAVTELSDQLGGRYFSHADRTTRSLMA
jgi:uncharacterized circularly permuted ATP-grasp superfamily protein/uncharacterized alpha-E superfamily protein